MKPSKLIELIREIEGVKTVQNVPVDPVDQDEMFLIITFEPEEDEN